MKFNPWIVASPLLMVVKFSDEQYSCKWREWAFLYVFACMYACMHVYDTLVSVLITDCRSLKKKMSQKYLYTSLLLFADDPILLAWRSAMLTMKLQPGNEPTSPSTYLYLFC